MFHIKVSMFLLFMLTLSIGSREATECSVPCKNSGRSCLSYSCEKTRLQTSCTFYDTSKHYPQLVKSSCATPAEVIGLPEFCFNLLSNGSFKIPANIHKDTPKENNDGHDIEADEIIKEEQCVSVFVMSCAVVGGFVAGCISMSLFLMLTGCVKRCCKCTEKDTIDASRLETPAGIPVQHHLGPERPNVSTAHQRLLSSVSNDSGLSSSHLVTPQQTHMARAYMYHQSPGSGRDLTEGQRSSQNQDVLETNAGRPFYPTPHLESIYSPVSEGSSRDYMSIIGGSENAYAPSSEAGSSDYNIYPTHRVIIIRDGDIYHPGSESSSSDYTSLRGNRVARGESGIYYAVSEGSNKDYASLAGDRDVALYSDLGNGNINDLRNNRAEKESENVSVNSTNRVVALPRRKLSRPIAKIGPDLADVNEYESLDDHTIRKRHEDIKWNPGTDIDTQTSVHGASMPAKANGACIGSQAERAVTNDEVSSRQCTNLDHELDYHEYEMCSDSALKHEYFVLEPMSSSNKKQ